MLPPRRRAPAATERAAGARTRNGVYAFAKEHPLYETHQQRLRSDPRIAVQNPGAAAKCFQVMVESIFEELVGVPLSHKTKATGVPNARRGKGLFGTVVDFLAAFECQGRGYVCASELIVLSQICSFKRIILFLTSAMLIADRCIFTP